MSGAPEFQQGETIRLGLARRSDSTSDLDILEDVPIAMMEPMYGPGAKVPFEVTYRAAQGDIGEGYDLVIPPAVTRDLKPGKYRADVLASAATDDDVISDPLIITIKRAVSRRT